MNRITIGHATTGGCAVCGDIQQVRVDLLDYAITGILPCPRCVDQGPLRRFVDQSADYLRRGKPLPEVIA